MRVKIRAVFAVLLLVALGLCSNMTIYADEPMKGIWITTKANLDYPSKATADDEALKAEADAILDDCRDMGFNNIFFQVRPFGDAFYKSSVYPWSQFITGKRGAAPNNGFDPLQYWIEGAHARGLKLHAWINPYRAGNITEDTDNMELESVQLCQSHPEYAVKYSDGFYYYDPAEPEVRQLVVDGVREIINNYDVDGIHLDDYFYPGTDFDDSRSFAKYGSGYDSKADWRRNNVDILISDLGNIIKAKDKNIEFGISPAGIWANSSTTPLGSNTNGGETYTLHYADTRKWALEGMVDYLAPQIYWERGHASADYTTLVNWWSDTLKNCNTKLYIGIADYKAMGVTYQGNPWYNGNEIFSQIELNRQVGNIDGEIHFRYRTILAVNGLKDRIASCYNNSNTVYTTQAATTAATVATTAAATTIAATVTESTTETTTQQTTAVQKPKNTDPNAIKVIVNGVYVDFDQQPVIENSRTLVPMRAIFEALGADVRWDNDTQSVMAESTDGKRITLIIGSKSMLVNNKDMITLDVAPKIMGSRTMVPLRAISEALDCKVDWDNAARLVTVTKD